MLASDPVDLEQLEPASSASTPSAPLPRAELLHVLMLPDFERADGKGNPEGDPPSFGVPLRAGVVPVGYGVGSVIELP